MSQDTRRRLFARLGRSDHTITARTETPDTEPDDRVCRADMTRALARVPDVGRPRKPANVLLWTPPDEPFGRAALAGYQAAGVQGLWSPTSVEPGEDAAQAEDARLAEARVIMLLMSTAVLTEDQDRLEYVLAQQARGARVIPILARFVVLPPLWERLQPVPRCRRPMAAWPDLDQAVYQVVAETRHLL